MTPEGASPDSLEEYFASKMADPDFRAAYEDSQELSRIVSALTEARKAKGLTQTQVANRLKVKQPSVSEFETEQKDPRVWTVQRYARAIGMRVRLSVVESEAAEAEDERLRAQIAAAWDEGFKAGEPYGALWQKGDLPPANPYQADAS